MLIEGSVWRFGDDVNTDVIVPGKYLKLSASEAAAHIMEGLDPAFASKVGSGDIIVAGKNFGCGSSRETAPHALKLAGISAVVAESFARIYFRNSFNLGLPAIECSAAGDISAGTTIAIDLETGVIHAADTGRRYPVKPFPAHLRAMLELGGLVPYLEHRLGVSQAHQG